MLSYKFNVNSQRNKGINETYLFTSVPGLKKLMKEETTMMDRLVMVLGELIGTAILVFVGCMSCVGSLGITPTLMNISLAFGIAVMIAIQVRIIYGLNLVMIIVII